MHRLALLAMMSVLSVACGSAPAAPRDAGDSDAHRGAVDAGRMPGLDAASATDAGPVISPDGGAPTDAARPDAARADAAPPVIGGGIAVRYPGDEGIDADPAVLFADDFERYASAGELERQWNAGVYHHVRIATEPEHVFSGTRAVELRGPATDSEVSNTIARWLDAEEEVIHVRFYALYAPSFDIVGSSHNGVTISGHYYTEGGGATPGIPADGTNKFLMSFEAGRETAADPRPGYLNVYIYHPEQRSEWGDHFFPNGTVIPFSFMPGDFGPEFAARPNIAPALDRWQCYEVMVRLNTPGSRDGRITWWLDGEVIADFPNIRLRDVESLRIDRVSLDFHFRSNPRETFKYYDDVVVATEYIGPRVPR